MSQFEMFITEGNEKADDLAKTEAMLDEGLMAEARAKTMQQEKGRRCMQLCSTRPASAAWQRNGKIVKSSGPSRRKSGFSWKRRARIRSIEQSGVRKQTGIVVCDVEEEVNI